MAADFSKGFWFLNCHATVQLSSVHSADGISVLRLRLPRDDAPPTHIHHTEDEVFHILGGAVRFRVGDNVRIASMGETVLGPKGMPHGFRVLSDAAEMLVITRGAFERLVCSMARPAEHDGPPALAVPSPALQAELASRCADVGIELVGPPIE